MFSYKTYLTRFLLIFSLGVTHSIVASEFPTAKQIFEDGSDPMLVTLTHLSYLKYDESNNFLIYKLMYGLDSKKRAELERYLKSETQNYKNQGWDIKFLDVGKGLFSNNDSPGAIIASKCSSKKMCDVKIAFRGTRSLNDWGNNLIFSKALLRFNDKNIEKSEYQKTYKEGQVHQGFLKAYNTISQEIGDTLKDLRSKNPEAKFLVRVGGHSLGGSLATLCAAHIAMTIKKDQGAIHLETYGSPRTLGEKLSAELLNLLNSDNVVRLVNKDVKDSKDMVSDIPLESILKTQFRHIGDECILTPLGLEIYEGFPKLKLS
ncbi:MAG: lipase family protein [Candidatus Paracaedibacter sp.]